MKNQLMTIILCTSVLGAMITLAIAIAYDMLQRSS
jgi:hypothetical protein